MKALVETHALVRGITLRDLFRSCYMAVFGKDISMTALDQDLSDFQSHGKTPPYVIKRFLTLIGDHA